MDYPTIISLVESELDLNHLLSQITLPTTGAVVFFTGTVRGQTALTGLKTDFLEYEAYPPMALSKMQQIGEEIREKWPAVEGIAIIQRIGRLPPGSATTLIACSSAHRNTGVFEAAKFGIDRLKEIVPIWKKEIGPKAEMWIEGGYHPDQGE
jgi:molybdopterin synthase catalytic subunit